MTTFRHLPVHDLTDVTHNFEQLESERATELQAGRTSGGAGAWTETMLSAKVEAAAGFQSPRVRAEGTTARLRGAVKTKAAGEVKAGETILTLPTGFRPPGTVALAGTFGATGLIRFEIASTGVMTGSENVAAERNIYLDGLTFALT